MSTDPGSAKLAGERERAWAALREDVEALRDEFGVDVSAWEK